jgi:hypothetical protein
VTDTCKKSATTVRLAVCHTKYEAKATLHPWLHCDDLAVKQSETSTKHHIPNSGFIRSKIQNPDPEFSFLVSDTQN